MGSEDPTGGSSVVVAGKYALAWEVAAGAMGRVFAATQLGLDRPVALKVMSGEGGPDFRQRFLFEAQALAKLNHRNIVTIFDSGETEDGLMFIAMEYLRGRTLSDAIKAAGRFAPLRALQVAMQVARGLRAAHRQGIVHRDLKPSNIFLVDDEDEDREIVKVFDFGIAKATVADEGVAGPLQTRVGMLVGTPAYMAPEQIEAQAVDARTDLYALGVVLFQMITGRPPFVEPKHVDLLLAHLSKPPPRLNAFVDGVPLIVESIVARLLAKAPSSRYASTDDVIAALGEAASLLGGDVHVDNSGRMSMSPSSRAAHDPSVDDLPLLEPLPPRGGGTPAPEPYFALPPTTPSSPRIQTAPTLSSPRPRSLDDRRSAFPRAALAAILIAAAVAAVSTQWDRVVALLARPPSLPAPALSTPAPTPAPAPPPPAPAPPLNASPTRAPAPPPAPTPVPAPTESASPAPAAPTAAPEGAKAGAKVVAPKGKAKAKLKPKR